MHSWEFELTKLTYSGLEDNLIRHRGDRLVITRTQLKFCFFGVVRVSTRNLAVIRRLSPKYFVVLVFT